LAVTAIKYDRICFDEELMNLAGLPDADFVCLGHPLLNALIDLVLDEHQEMLRSGAVLIDKIDAGERPWVLFFLEQYILALVEVQNGEAHEPRYVRNPFGKEPDFGVTSVNYTLKEMLTRGTPPS
jgi:hypothetical protein